MSRDSYINMSIICGFLEAVMLVVYLFIDKARTTSNTDTWKNLITIAACIILVIWFIVMFVRFITMDKPNEEKK